MSSNGRYILTFGLVALGLFALMMMPGWGAVQVGADTIVLESDDGGKEGLVMGALASASDGDTILLTKGLFFEENVVVDKEVHIEGDGESYLVANSVQVLADNMTFRTLTITLDPGVMTFDGDNWTLWQVVLQECIGDTCVKSVGTVGGRIMSSTIIAGANDAVQLNGTRDVVIRDSYLYAPHTALWLSNVTGVLLENIRVAQSYFGLYLSWGTNVTIDHSVFDTRGWGLLLANSTNVTVTDSLLLSNSVLFGNYGTYIAYSEDVLIENCTLTANAAAISMWKSDVTIRWNSIFGNLEGVWGVDSSYTMEENALFSNMRYNLNTTGGVPRTTDNYWGTTSSFEAKGTLKGDAVIDPVRTSDPTPDAAPLLLNDIPSEHISVEDAANEVIYDLCPHFSDDTWYYQAYMPSPSQIRFEVVHNSDPANTSLRIGEASTCSGSCPVSEGTLKASTSSNWYGTIDVRVRAVDWRGKHVDTNTFTIVFLPKNDRPVMSLEGVPKNSLLEMSWNEKRTLNVTIFDDGPSEWLEVKLDDGEWERVQEGLPCIPDNSSRTRDLPSCSRTTYVLKATKDLTPGKHTLALRTCDGELCSDEVYTGKYEIEVDYKGREEKTFSSEGAGIALFLLLLVVMVALATMPRTVPEERPKGTKVKVKKGKKGRSSQ